MTADPGRSCAVRRQTPHMTRPCPRCPWRKDVSPGEFPLERFLSLWSTSHQVEYVTIEDIAEQPMFACHLTREGQEKACAGWLAVAGHANLRVRMDIARGSLPMHVLQPLPDWPELFDSFEEMVERQAVPLPPAGWTEALKTRR